MLIQWFPGHMAKTKRLIIEHLKAVDVALELLDARIPLSSANPMVEELIQGKNHLVILNKADLADSNITQAWVSYYKQKGVRAIPVSSTSNKDRKKLLSAIKETATPSIAKWERRGVKNRSARIMILGIPNVGKSTLINRLAKTAATRTANTPGHTRGKQWVRLAEGLDLLDTPGVLWPKFEDQVAAMRLAATGAIAGEIFDSFEVVSFLLKDLAVCAPDILNEKYGIQDMQADPLLMVEQIGRRRGSLLSGGVVDTVRAQQAVLSDFRSGKLGTITLDGIPEAE